MPTQISSFSLDEINAVRFGLKIAIADYEKFYKSRPAKFTSEMKMLKRDLDSALIKVEEILKNGGIGYNK